MVIVLTSGICRRVAVAAMSLLCESVTEAESCQQFSLHTVNDAFLAISVLRPTLMVQWCNILILLNYGEQSWWSQLLQTSQLQLSSMSQYVFQYFKLIVAQLTDLIAWPVKSSVCVCVNRGGSNFNYNTA